MRLLIATALFAIALALAGCGSKPMLVSVTGKVTHKGKTVTGGSVWFHPEGGTEPIGQRIIQIPEDPLGTEIRDPHAGFIAYVPPGSIAKGATLVKNGNCANCHGEALKGKGEVPRLAGLQPLTIARQLYLIKHGSSAGAGVAPMKPVVAKMNDDEIISISSYLGSLPPA